MRKNSKGFRRNLAGIKEENKIQDLFSIFGFLTEPQISKFLNNNSSLFPETKQKTTASASS